jgi:HPt (histidine-containing phosphotransfer) domain-containing protein
MIMKVLKTIWKFINSRIFGYVVIGAFILLLVGMCGRNSNLKEENKIQEQNLAAQSDTIKNVVLENGELQASKNAYMATAKELREYNKELSDEVKNQKGKVVTLNRIVFKLQQDTADLQKYIDELLAKYEKPKRINDSTWNVDWTLPFVYDSTNYDIFTGRTQVGIRGPQSYFPDISLTHNKTWLLNRNSQMSLTWGQKWEGSGKNKRLKVYAQTSHPAFKTQLLEGTYVDYPTKKHWFTGFSVGPQLGVGYDFLNNQPTFTIGLGIQYNVYSW